MSKRIEVDIATQTIKAFDGAKQIYGCDCVTGDSSHPTDKGTFHTFLKDKTHVSHKYNVKMNYAMFFTHDGKAIHQYHGPAPFSVMRMAREHVSDWIGSHGCVRLKEEDARTLFDWAPMHTQVIIR
jgi:lipoprotein-anchoring transpeptidase ErfK/SrfK